MTPGPEKLTRRQAWARIALLAVATAILLTATAIMVFNGLPRWTGIAVAAYAVVLLAAVVKTGRLLPPGQWRRW